MPRRRPFSTKQLPETYVASQAALRACVAKIDQVEAVGFDTEFIGEDSYRPELCLIQISLEDQLFLIDPYGCDDLSILWQALLAPHRVVVAHAGREEIRMIYFATGQRPQNLFDLQIVAGLLGYVYPIGYAGLVQEVLHQSMTKSETLTDWRKRPLSANQVRYAYDDVRYLLPIYKQFAAKLSKWHRHPWAAEEFRGLVEHSLGESATVERWRKIKGLGVLNRRELAIARELYTWREGYACKTNRPTRYLMRDELLIEIARRQPKTVDELNSFRGLPRAELDSILNAVQRGAEVPNTAWPELLTRESDPPQVNTLAQLLTMALNELCRAIKIAPNLAATQTDLKQLIRQSQQKEPDEATCNLRRGWRAEAIFPYLSQILSGDMVLRVSKPASRFPVSFEAILPSETTKILAMPEETLNDASEESAEES